MKGKKSKTDSTLKVTKGKNITFIVIITVVVLILVIAGLFFALYSSTDLFKSSKQLFMKNLKIAIEENSGAVDEEYKNYIEKKETTPYTNEGTYVNNIVDEKERYNDINKFNISFSGKIDKANNKTEQEISFNYNDENKFPFKYKKDNEKIGIQCDYLVENKYTTADIDKLDKVFGEDFKESYNQLTSIADKNTIDINKISNDYSKIFEQLDEEDFTKNENTFTLTLKGEEAKQVANAVLNVTSKNKIFGITEKQIETISSQLQNQNFDDNNKLELKVTKINNIYEISINMGATSISIKRNKIQDNIEYDITANVDLNLFSGNQQNDENKSQPITIDLKATYENMETNDVSENYTITIKSTDINTSHTLTNNIKFEESIEIEDFNEENSQDLTAQDDKLIEGLVNSAKGQLLEVNAELQNQAEMRNSIMCAVPIYDVLTISLNSFEDFSSNIESESSDENVKKSKVESVRTEAQDKANSAINSIFAELLIGDISNYTEKDILQDFELESVSKGQFGVKLNSQAEDGEELIAIIWIPPTDESEDYGEPIEVKIIKDEEVNAGMRIDPDPINEQQ